MSKRQRENDCTLRIACSEGRLKTVRDLLNSGLDVDSKAASRHPGFGRTALHIACRRGHSEVVRELLNRGADMEAVDDFRSTPLHEACTAGHLEVVRELLDRHADMEAVDKYHETPLHVACSFDCLEVIRELLDRGANIEAVANGYTPLFTASSVQVVHLLLSRGASVNAVDSSGNTALHRACLTHNLDVATLLLDFGADVNARGQFGHAPLELAIYHDQLELVRLLLARGAAEIGASSRDPQAVPLYYSYDVEIVKALLDAGVDSNARGNLGKTVLEEACSYVSIDVVRLLLSRGASFASWDRLIALADSNDGYFGGKRSLIKFLEEYNK